MNKSDRAKLVDLRSYLVRMEFEVVTGRFPSDAREASQDWAEERGRRNAAKDARYRLEELFPELEK